MASQTVSEGIQCEIGCEAYRNCLSVVKEEIISTPDNLASISESPENDEFDNMSDVKPVIHHHTESAEHHIQYVCGFCGETFLIAEELESHCYQYHPGDVPFKCHHCGKLYKAWLGCKGFRAHLNGACAFTVDNSSQCFSVSDGCNENNTSPSQLKTIDFCELVCGDCGIQFSASSLYEKHCRSHNLSEPFKCIECVMRFKRCLHLEEHKASHLLVNPYQCSECGKEFSFKWALLIHSKLHGNHSDVMCCVCGALFLCQEYLVNHKLLEHKDISEHQTPLFNIAGKWCDVHSDQLVPCSVCEEKDDQLGVKFPGFGLVCEECGVQFLCEEELHSHLQCHETPHPFKCEECDKSYGSYLGLREHVSSNHNDVEVNWCEGCSGTGYIHVTLRSECDVSDEELHNVEVIQEMVEIDDSDSVPCGYDLFSSKKIKPSSSEVFSRSPKRKSSKGLEKVKHGPQNSKHAKARNAEKEKQQKKQASKVRSEVKLDRTHKAKKDSKSRRQGKRKGS